MRLGLLVLAVGMAAACNSKSSNPVAPQPTQPRLLNTDPQWAPSGRVLAFRHEAQDSSEWSLGVEQIWIADLDSGTTRFVAEGHRPRWSPDGKKLVFVRSGDIYVHDLSSGSETLLTGFSTSSFFPDWSPDGTRIVFDTDYQDPRRAHAIWLIQSDGTNLVDISVHGTGEWRMARWSPDGSLLVHVRWLPAGGPGPELFLMTPQGTDAVQLTHGGAVNYYPCWAPDGSHIAWRRDSGGPSGFGIWTMRVDGSEARLILPGGDNPSWSSAGNEISYSHYDPKSGGVTIWIAAPDGSNATPLDLSSLRANKVPRHRDSS